MKLYGITKVWPKWQIVIPQEARENLWIKPQDKVVILSASWKWIIIAPTDEIKKHLKEFENLFNNNQ